MPYNLDTPESGTIQIPQPQDLTQVRITAVEFVVPDLPRFGEFSSVIRYVVGYFDNGDFVVVRRSEVRLDDAQTRQLVGLTTTETRVGDVIEDAAFRALEFLGEIGPGTNV